MTQTMIAISLLVVTILIVGLLGHLLLLAAVAVSAYLVGRWHTEGRLVLGRRRSRGSLGR